MANQNGNPSTISKLQIEAIQTVTPCETTGSRQVRRVTVSKTDPINSAIFRRCLHVILYYNKVNEESSGWFVAGWTKESLGRALVEQPMLCGRLRRGEDGFGDLEIVSNDSGVRLIEAKVPVTLSEFLDRKSGSGEDLDENELVFWKDIDEQNPQYSPLFYIQVTNFECGGYSVGISCSLLLTDLLITKNFLKRWAEIHKIILSQNDVGTPKTPIFYFPNLKKNNCSPSITPDQTQNSGQTMIFNFSSQNLNLTDDKSDIKKHVSGCLQAAEKELGGKTTSEAVPLFIKEYSSDEIKIETLSNPRQGKDENHEILKVGSAKWDDLGVNDVAFCEGKENKPTRVKFGMGSVLDGVAMAILLPAEKSSTISGPLRVIVSIPTRKVDT